MANLIDILKKISSFLKKYKVVFLLVFIIILIIGTFLFFKKEVRKDNRDVGIKIDGIISNDTQNKNSEAEDYNYKLIIKTDQVSKYGIVQSIWAKYADGREVQLYSDSNYSYGNGFNKKSFGYDALYTDFNEKVPQNNRYGFFELQRFADYDYVKLVFDKKTREIKTVSSVPTLIDNAFIFSPDYKHLAVLHTPDKKSDYENQQSDDNFYVDLVDTATLDIISRYYLPEKYNLFAMNYAEDAGRASWDNIWLNNAEFQVAQFKNRITRSLWRADFEKHIVSIKSLEKAKESLSKATDVKYGFEDNDNLYVLTDDEYYILVKYNFGEAVKSGDLHYNLFFTSTSSKNITVCDDEGPAGELFVKTRINKDDFSSVSPTSSSDSAGCY